MEVARFLCKGRVPVLICPPHGWIIGCQVTAQPADLRSVASSARPHAMVRCRKCGDVLTGSPPSSPIADHRLYDGRGRVVTTHPDPIGADGIIIAMACRTPARRSIPRRVDR